MNFDGRTVYGIYAAVLPSEYDLEIRELNRKQFFDREKITNIVQAQVELLRKKKQEESSSPHALVADGGCGGGGGRGRAGGKRGGKSGGRGRGGGNSGNSSNSQKSGESGHAAGAGKQPAKGRMCFHYRG